MFGTGTASFAAGCYWRGEHSESYADPVALDASFPRPARRDAGAEDDGATKPPPFAGGGNVLLFKGQAAFLATGAPCTNESGATGDRWCAFTSPSTSRPEGVDLFVVNASRASAGVAISCGGAVVDPNCLRLTGGFFEESEAPAPHAAGFQGDTLVYFDETGTAYGWRPGMLDGRQLATGILHDCLPSQRGASVLCLRDLDDPSSTDITRSQLLVGTLAGTSVPPLTVVDTVISADIAVSTAQVGLRMGFGPDGSDVIWSSRAVRGGPEILKTQKVGDAATRITVASDVSRWRVSPDGTRWYWLSQFNYDVAGKPSGALQTAPFPTGGAPATLLAAVGNFSVIATGAIVAQTRMSGSRGTLQAIPDPVTAPGNVTTIDSGVLGVLSAGAHEHVAYAKVSDGVFGFYDFYVKRLDGTGGVCVLTNQPLAPARVTFTPSGAGVLWARVTNLDDPVGTPFKFRVSLTRFSDCAAMPLANDVSAFGTISDNRVLLQDDFDGNDGRLQLKYLAGENVVGPTPPVLIQTRVSGFAPVAGNAGLVLFTVGASSAADGLYLYVAKPPSSPVDGGASDRT
jgi:hypothetical protein